jgi:hypothetical protein
LGILSADPERLPAHPQPARPPECPDPQCRPHPAGHRFYADDFSLLDDGVLDWRYITGSRQLSDAYLLAMAVRRDLRLVTFDRGISLPMVLGAQPHHLVTLSA